MHHSAAKLKVSTNEYKICQNIFKPCRLLQACVSYVQWWQGQLVSGSRLVCNSVYAAGQVSLLHVLTASQLCRQAMHYDRLTSHSSVTTCFKATRVRVSLCSHVKHRWSLHDARSGFTGLQALLRKHINCMRWAIKPVITRWFRCFMLAVKQSIHRRAARLIEY